MPARPQLQRGSTTALQPLPLHRTLRSECQITWSFSFQILSEIRHLIMDFGYGFELKTTKITGLIVIFGSFILTVSIYLIGRNLF